MKKITVLFFAFLLTTIVYGQETKISIAPTINNAFYYQPVTGGAGHNSKSGFGASIDYLVRKGKRINLGLGVGYQFCRIEYTPNMNTGDFVGQTDRISLISFNLISTYNFKKNFYVSLNPSIDFQLNYHTGNITDRQTGCGVSFSFGKQVKLNERILLNLEPKVWIHNIIPFYDVQLANRVTVAGLNAGLIFGDYKE